MPRNARCVLPGLPYHVTQPGTNRQAVFHSIGDRRTYLGLVRENLEDAGAQLLTSLDLKSSGIDLETEIVAKLAAPQGIHV